MQDLVLALKVHSDNSEGNANGEECLQNNLNSNASDQEGVIQSGGDCVVESQSCAEGTPACEQQAEGSGSEINSSSKSDLIQLSSDKDVSKEENTGSIENAQELSH